MDCVSEALQPNLRGSAQVGSLWYVCLCFLSLEGLTLPLHSSFSPSLPLLPLLPLHSSFSPSTHHSLPPLPLLPPLLFSSSTSPVTFVPSPSPPLFSSTSLSPLLFPIHLLSPPLSLPSPQPSLPRKTSHTTLECHQHSLSLLLLLCQLLKEHLPAGDTFVNVFNSVMPLWLDLLVQLRAEPGKMEKFQDHFK